MMLTLVRLLIYNNVMSLENRRFCARLIQEVLAGRRLTREALKRFPKENYAEAEMHLARLR